MDGVNLGIAFVRDVVVPYCVQYGTFVCVLTACVKASTNRISSVPGAASRILGVRVLYAIVETGGKQFKVSEGMTLYVEKLDAVAGDTVTLDKVFLVEKDGQVTVGTPHVPGASVTASVVEHGKAKKIHIFKYKSKKNYRRRQGHRQPYTKLKVNAISV